MTNRDRLVVMGLAALAVLAAVWFLAVAPERSKASKLTAQVSAARAELTKAQGQVADARGAQAGYASSYASLVRLGKAVPPDEQVPSLVYELDQASNHEAIDFSSITSGASASGALAAPAATPVVSASAGFVQLPFTFVFNGSYFDLYHLFNQLNRFTLRTASGSLQVTGRLLTIQSANLDLNSDTNSKGVSTDGELTGTITATAYVLPSDAGLTGGATAAGPAGTTATPATATGSTTAPTTPAVVKVTP
jgi:Tfp pilus assembly protein PilO